MDGGKDGAFLSPVSSLRRAEDAQRRAQQERIRAVPVSRRSDEFAAHTKRKQLDAREAVGGRDAAAQKRRRRSSPAKIAREQASITGDTLRYLTYERADSGRAKTAVVERRAPRELSFSSPGDGARAVDYEGSTGNVSDGDKASDGLGRGSDASSDPEDRALPLFSRYKDPTVLQYEDAAAATAVDTPTRAFNVETATQQQLYRRLYGEDASDDTWEFIQRHSATTGMVDLSTTPDLSRLETVEGSDILETLMTTNTPRAGRRFPAEQARTDSEEREQNFLRRRLIARRKKYSVKQMTAKWESEAAHFADDLPSASRREYSAPASTLEEDTSLFHFRDSPIRVRSPVMSIAKTKDASPDQPPPPLKESVYEDDTVGDHVNIIESDEEDSDSETTDAVLSRLREIKDVTWRYFLLWFVAGSLLLCTVIVSVPYIRRQSESRLPYCDSTWSDIDSETRAISSIQELTQASALQPYVALSALTERPSCQPCPLYGNCLGGDILSCSAPYELHYGVCVENPGVRQDLARIASGIEQFVLARVTDRTCEDISIWPYMTPALLKSANSTSFDLATPIQVLIMELRTFVATTVHYGGAVLDLPHDYVFNRALVMALRNLRDIFVGGDINGAEGNGIIYVSTALAPWICQAQHRLYSHAYLIAGAIVLSTLVGFRYIRSVTSRDQRQLIDRLYKEARFNLLRRAGGPERLYPAEHLREDLMDAHAIAPLERQRLRDTTWPRVVALLLEDPRICSQTIKLHGKDTLVLEWASATDKKADGSSSRHRDRRRARKSLPARTTLPP